MFTICTKTCWKFIGRNSAIVIITSKDILLLDTGLGLKKRELQIHKTLHAGINPSDITKVLLTHLHKDHAGEFLWEQITRIKFF
jgi:glyoxylase-like metal-dependent hydrolase (beta-lactamase superfamily II)